LPFFNSLKEQCPWIGLMFAVRHSVHRHGQRWVRNRRQVLNTLNTGREVREGYAKGAKEQPKKSTVFFAFFA
jgi:hypothetical protein